MLQTAVHTAVPHVRGTFSKIVDSYHAVNATVRSREIKRLCTACRTIHFERSLDANNANDGSSRSTDFIWPIDHVIVQRDSCTFCRLIFDALSTKLNDPLKADQILEFLQEDLKSLTFKEWAVNKYDWVHRAASKSDKVWPFGCSKDPPETREAVRELIESSKEEMRHLDASQDVAMMMAAGAAVAQTSRLASGKQMPQGTVVMAEAAEGLMWSSALYKSSKGNRLPCWIVGTVGPGSIKIEVCARGRQPRARLSLIRSFSVLIQTDEMGQGNMDSLSWHYGREVCDRVDLRLAGALLSACERSHEASCGTSRGEDSFGRLPSIASNSPPIRLIDIPYARLREFQTHELPNYVALSYVWGGNPGQGLNQSNKAQLHRPGGLLAAELSATITAAIQITESLGRGYLWVDRWCIVQSDSSDQSEQIDRMDVIYRKADVTLVAADHNQTALSGIKGVTAGTSREDFDGQVCQRISDTPGLFGLIPMSVKQNLETWESRAWTFQEKVMSNRLLVFSEGYMVWHCRSCIAREDMTDDDAGTDQIKPLLQPAFRELDRPQEYSVLPLSEKGVYQRSKTFGIYASLVHQYTGRALSHRSDILRAFTAISKELSIAFQCDFHCGFPESIVDAALLWQPSNSLFLTRREGFPSWSWAGWGGKVRYDRPFGIRTNDDGALVQAIKQEGDERLRPCTFIFKLLPKSINTISLGLLEPLASQDMVPEDWEARRLPRGHHGRIKAALETCIPGNLDQALCFESTTASFEIAPEKPRTVRFRVEGGPVVEMEEVWKRVKRSNNSSAGRVKIHDETWQLDHCEFLVLSEAQFFGSESHIEALGYTLYNVLAFKRVCQNGKVCVIERIGIGKIEKQAWHRAGPKREIFLLQ